MMGKDRRARNIRMMEAFAVELGHSRHWDGAHSRTVPSLRTMRDLVDSC